MAETAIELIKRDENISQAFRDALQLPFMPADFRRLLKTEAEDNAEIGRSFTCNLRDYYGK
jgi:hypothetical protein